MRVDWNELDEREKCSVALRLFRDDLIDGIEGAQDIQTAKRFKSYLKQLRETNIPPWMQVIAVRICLKNDPDLRNTRAFVKWAVRYKDYIV